MITHVPMITHTTNSHAQQDKESMTDNPYAHVQTPAYDNFKQELYIQDYCWFSRGYDRTKIIHAAVAAWVETTELIASCDDPELIKLHEEGLEEIKEMIDYRNFNELFNLMLRDWEH